MRAECNYKIGIERKVREKVSEMVQPLISSVTSYASMKHYRGFSLIIELLAVFVFLFISSITFGNG